MNTVFTTKTVKARKQHDCMASKRIRESGFDQELDGEELAEYTKAKERGFKIQVGEENIYQTGIYESDFYTYRAIPAISDICFKYDLFED